MEETKLDTTLELMDLLEKYKHDYARTYVRLHNDINLVAGTDNIEELERLNNMADLLNSMIATRYVRQAGYYFNNDSERWERTPG